MTGAPWILPALGPLYAQWPHEHVLGFPLLVGITIRANRPDASLNGLPLPALSRTVGAVGLRVRDTAGYERVLLEPSPPHDDEQSSFHLGRGEQRRILVELARFIDPLGPGTYGVELTYAAAWTRATAAPAALVVRAPTPAEAALQARVAAEPSGSWQEWIRLPATREILDDAFALSPPLAYLRALRYLYSGPEPLAEIEPRLFDPITGVAAAEGYLLRAEVAWARGAGPELGGLTAWLRHHRPDLGWWLDKILRGESDIAFQRQWR